MHITAKATHVLKESSVFVLTTFGIFLLIFASLNAGAYKKKIDFWLAADTADALAGDMLAGAPTENARKKILIQEGETHEVTLPTFSASITPPDNYLFIPRLNISAPIRTTSVPALDNWDVLEKSIQDSLRDGVVRFPGTAQPGQKGNAFITGHSSYYPWDTGRYKDVFALLPEIEIDEEIIVFWNQQKYVYRVNHMHEVQPNETDVLKDVDSYQLTLMTCTPIGTALKRLIVTAELQTPSTQNARLALK